MTDTQHSTLNTPCIWLGIPERRMWIIPHFKIPHSNTWIWCWSLKCRVLINRHKFRAWTQNLWWILRTLHSGFTLYTQDSPIQMHWVLSVECWVSVISLGPGHWYAVFWEDNMYWFLGRCLKVNEAEQKGTFEFLHQTAPELNQFKQAGNVDSISIANVFFQLQDDPKPWSTSRSSYLMIDRKEFKSIVTSFRSEYGQWTFISYMLLHTCTIYHTIFLMIVKYDWICVFSKNLNELMIFGYANWSPQPLMKHKCCENFSDFSWIPLTFNKIPNFPD